jgi:hypothetical protein
MQALKQVLLGYKTSEGIASYATLLYIVESIQICAI